MAAVRRVIDSTSFWKRSTGLNFQILTKDVHNSVRFVGAVRWPFTSCSKTSQRCSKEFKSGLLGGHFMIEKSVEYSSNQPVAHQQL
ncbi:hypothetical protein TNCV_3185831 [Trichonephila clavipes]|nr:hypothetical protein TNCV_3185831 [Trichonephila clavipes]